MVTKPTRPLVAVVGTTGVGKSQLAVELARSVSEIGLGWQSGSVINADAMQVYNGLDVITNKITEAEMCGVPHHLIGFKKPGETYVVFEWLRDAETLIEKLHGENVLPIAAGGTSYWVQNLIFPNRLPSLDTGTGAAQTLEKAPSSSLSSAISTLTPALLELWQNLPERASAAQIIPDDAFRLHSLLCHLDPQMGARWHWKDTRKVLRSLEIIKENGCLASEVIASQKQEEEPRYRSLIFWLYAKPEQLNPRLDARVDKMLQQGLLDEIKTMRSIAIALNGQSEEALTVNTDYTQGIFQSIGYKEFDEYLSSSDPPEELLQASLDQMKHATKKYAQRQVKWIRDRLLPAVNNTHTDDPPVLVLLDATELGDKWDLNVKNPAIEALRDFLEGAPMRNPRTLSDVAREMLSTHKHGLSPTETLLARRKRQCTICTSDPTRPVMLEEGREWQVHVKSRAHRTLAGKEKKVAEQMAQREEKQRIRRERRGDSSLVSE
ncbi:hypothetical protein BOTBODRAFT_177046 [Botryobasidium botryosum FD-172 SS1]|uniref:tRNA dimethylallyltransferase n=1 Tax=Botryobasidium botryosum (strain FD-172 SS1) TaxID=930990 RepID=A0A067M7U2_BOTB1|nr:hypothetical protein BOTBODRAFT_177046 [Botryobasidium botryosum FD-172 SS1]